MSAPTVVSLFSGCGGLDIGFQQEGFSLKFAADNDPAAVAAYTGNLGHAAVLLDVRDDDLRGRMRALESADVLLGGFPCQGFSKAGPKRETDERNQLYLAMITALESLSPKVFVAENVDGLMQNFNGAFLERIVADCAGVGYSVDWKIVDAAWFGVPQHRRRVVIVGVRNDINVDFIWPTATHRWIARNGERAVHASYPKWANDLEHPLTIKNAFEGLGLDVPDHDPFLTVAPRSMKILRRIPEGKKLCNVRHDETSIRTWDIPEVFGETTVRERALLEAIARNRRHRRYGSIPNGNPLGLVELRNVFSPDLEMRELESLADRGFLKQLGEKWDLRGAMFASGLYKRPLLDQPSPTVLTLFENPRYFAHPREDRPFTVREVARLQTFPDTYQFGIHDVDPADAYRLIGNAVPPRMASALARAVLGTLHFAYGSAVTGVGVGQEDVASAGAART